jgi:hypothetical protein
MFIIDDNTLANEILGITQDKIKDDTAFNLLYDKVIKYFAKFEVIE